MPDSRLQHHLTLVLVLVLAVAVLAAPVSGATVGMTSASADRVSAGSTDGPASIGFQDTTAPNISAYSVTNPNGQKVRVSFESDEQLGTIEVAITGMESATMTTADFSESSDGGTYTYTGTYGGGSDGDYTATLENASDSAGNDGSSGQSGTVTVDTRVPQISNYTVTNPSGQYVTVSFDTGEQLAEIEVLISGPESGNLTTADFTETSSGGTYTYTATYNGSSDGTYEAALEVAADDAGNDGASTERGTTTVDTTPPTISAFDVSNPAGQNVTITFESNEQIDVIYVAIDGVESASLFRSDFGGVENDDTFTYTATYAGSSDGNYTATLETAKDTDGNNGASGENETVTVDTSDTTPPNVSAFEAANPEGQNVSISFDSDEQLDAIEVAISGAESATLSASSFTQTESDGAYSYTATYGGDSDGNYTVTLETAADSAGNDGAGNQSASVTVDTTAPTISAFKASNPSDRDVQVSFDSNERLETIEVSIDGPESATLSTADFTAAVAGGSYTYSATYSGSADGNYTVTLETATDAAGNGAPANLTTAVEVSTPDETDPTAEVGSDRTVEVGETVSFDGSGSSDNVGISSYEWDLDGDGTVDATGATIDHSYAEAGTYTVTLTVTDEAGNAGTATLTVTVEDQTGGTTTSDTMTDVTTTDETSPGEETDETAAGETTTDDSSSSSGWGDGFTVTAVLIAIVATTMLAARRR